jgi:carotenoid cleavage dioxygenase-like enzyme
MKATVHARHRSLLPRDDDHPYRTGAWRPQTTEWDASELDVLGEIPRDLAGVYLRNTENPLIAAGPLYHPFDGDGMLHAIAFQGGSASYRNRFVRTLGLGAEQAAGRQLWSGIAERPERAERTDGWGARGRMKDASSTDVVVQRGVALSSFYQCGDLYRLDPLTLEDLGRESWGGRFPAEGVSAHMKVDEATGELLFFNYGKEPPYMHYGVVSQAGELVHYVDVPLPGPRLPHDMAFTERYAILNDCPLFWDPAALAKGVHANRFFPELPTRFAILPRRGRSDEIRWFEAAPTFVLHWINAYEDGDEVVLDGFFQHDPAPALPEGAALRDRLFRFLDLYAFQARPHRWRFDLRTGRTREEPLSDRVMEFGMINAGTAGRPYRYHYDVTGVPGAFLFGGVVKHDVVTGREEAFEFASGVYGSETAMAPRLGSASEDDGYLVTFVSDLPNDRSECWIFHAQALSDGPLARVALPERISSGTHACWAPASALSGG